MPDPSTRAQWFVVLPDIDGSQAAAGRILSRAAQVISYDSGRPWLAGDWDAGSFRLLSTDAGRLALVGQYSTASAEALRSARSVDRVTESLPGSYHVIAQLAGRVRIRGTASGVRRVHHCRREGVTIASDRAEVLAGLTGYLVDERELALRLVVPIAPHPLGDTSVWRGVRTVPADSDLELGIATGVARECRRWRAPVPALPLAEAANRVRAALSDAVDARTSAGGLIGSDLSGGMDSTALCFLAARSEAKVVAYTCLSLDPADDDLQWAKLAAGRMPHVEHEIVPADEIARHYAGLDTPAEPFDEPCLPIAERARLRSALRRPADRGARLHLTGFGGDELASGSSSYLRGMLWRAPWQALRLARVYRATFRWSWGETLQLTGRVRSYRSWFRGSLAEPRPSEPNRTVPVDWGYPAKLPPWMHPDAVAFVRDTFRAAAENASPLDADPSQHFHLTCLRGSARIVAQFEQVARNTGVTLAAPFYDDAVVEAFLSARPAERSAPWQYKPLLTTAMRGIVPPENLARVTKAGSPVHEITGRRLHRGTLSALWEDSRLARLGLIDVARLREVFDDSRWMDAQQDAYHRTLAAELWLRDVENRR